MLLSALQQITVIFGISAVCLSMYLAGRFYRSKHELGLALSIMLLGESLMGAFTVGFSLLTATGFSFDLHPWHELVMRWIIFGAAASTSIHLAYKVRQTTQIKISKG